MLDKLKNEYDKIEQAGAESLDANKLKDVIALIHEIRSKLI